MSNRPNEYARLTDWLSIYIKMKIQ